VFLSILKQMLWMKVLAHGIFFGIFTGSTDDNTFTGTSTLLKLFVWSLYVLCFPF
jgi:hypothetical protein